MDEKLWIALIAAGGSVIVAVISLVTAILSRRATARSAVALEAMKQDFVRSGEIAEAKRLELAKSLEGIRLALQSIQLMRDEILLVTSSTPATLDRGEARQRLMTAKERLFETYQAQHPVLSDFEARTLHRAKNRVISIDTGRIYSIAELDAIRADLAESQAALRDSLTNRLVNQAVSCD